MKLKLLIATLLFCFIASAQITDPNVLRNYINANVIPNNTRNVTAQQLNNILNGQLNVMQIADIDSFATSPTFDTLFIYQHNAAGQKVRKGYHIGGNFDTSHLNDRINSLNTTKLNASDSLSKYVTPSQLQQVSGGNVYHPGDNIVQISGSAISLDTITGVPTKNFVFANFPPKTRTINSKALTGNIQLNKGDFPDLNVVDNTSDMDKPLSNKQRDSLTRKVDKTTTVNGKSLSGNIAITQDDIGLSNADNTHDADKPVSDATKDSLNASTFQKSLIRSSDLTRDNTVNAGDYQFNIAAKTVSIKGKGMTTKFGVIQNPNSNTNLLAALVGTGIVRSGYTFTAANATPILTLLNNGYEVVVNLNAIAQDGSRGFLSVAELPQFRKTLDSLFTTYFTGRNAHVFFNMNEQFNTGYYITDSASWSKYAAMQFVFDSVVHAHGGLTSDGGLTGNAMKWMPYRDLLDQGRTDDANEYAQSEFTASEIAGGLNWDVTGPYKLQIYLTRQWLNAIKNNSSDFINLHWKTPTNGINSDSINIRPFQWAVQYYARASGKPVISNELGSKSTKPYIAKQLFKAATDLNFYLGIWYSGTGTTFNAEDINLLNGSTLSIVGSGVKGSLDTANAAQRIAMTVQDGKVSYPGVGMGTKLPAYFDENNNLVPGPATVGMLVDTPAINRAIGGKADSSDVTKKVDKITGKGLSTRDYSTNDSNAVATIPTLATKDTTTRLRTDVNTKLDSSRLIITTLAGLRSLSSVQSRTVFQITDYGGGLWYKNPNSTIVDDTVLNVRTADGSVLTRIVSGQGWNIKWWVANYDSTQNIQPYINAAIQFVGRKFNGGTIYFPSGTYRSWPLGAGLDNIIINRSNITLRGENRGSTKITFYPYTNIDPDSTGGFPLGSSTFFNGQVYRGFGFLLGKTYNTYVNNITVENLTLEGNKTFTDNRNYPASTSTGDGWDVTHKCFASFTSVKDVFIRNCIITNWGGEIVYNGSDQMLNWNVEYCTISGTNGDCISGAGFASISHNDMSFFAGNGVENASNSATTGSWTDNDIHDSKQGNGITAGGATDNNTLSKEYNISNNRIKRVYRGVLLSNQIRNVSIHDNWFTDCKSVAIDVEPNGNYKVNDIHIYQNHIRAEDSLCALGITLNGNAQTLRNIFIHDNDIKPTDLGLTAGKSISSGITYYGTGMNGEQYIYNNLISTSSSQFIKLATTTKNPVFYGNKFFSGTVYTSLFTGSNVTLGASADIMNYQDFPVTGAIDTIKLDATTASANSVTRINNASGNGTKFFFQKSASTMKMNEDITLAPGDYATFSFNGTKWELQSKNIVGQIPLYTTDTINTLATQSYVATHSNTATTVRNTDSLTIEGAVNKWFTVTRAQAAIGVQASTPLTYNAGVVGIGVIPYQFGGTGLNTLGTAGQSIRVKSDLSGYEFYTPSSGTGTGAQLSAGNGILINGSTTGFYDGSQNYPVAYNPSYAYLWTALHTYNEGALGAATADALLLTNTTAATASVQQFSPAMHMTAQGWKTTATAASQSVDMKQYLSAVAGTANPSSILNWAFSVNGGSYSNAMTLTSAGLLSTTSITLSGTITSPGFAGNTLRSAGSDFVFYNNNTTNRNATLFENGDLILSSVTGATVHTNLGGKLQLLKTFTSSSGTDVMVRIQPTYNQTGTAGSADIFLNRTNTALGSGTHRLIDLQVNGASKFFVDISGNTTANSFIKSGGTSSQFLMADGSTSTSSGGSGLDPTHPVYTGSTPTITNLAASNIDTITISGKDANMIVRIHIPTGQSVNGYAFQITYAGSFSGASVVVPKITPLFIGTDHQAIGAQAGVGDYTTTGFKAKMFAASAGVYYYSISCDGY